MVDDLFDRRSGERLSDYAQRMLDLMQVAKSMVEFEMGGGIDFDVAITELQEIIDGDGKALAVREVRKALDFARPYFPRLEIPAYPSDNDLIEAAMEMVRQHEAMEMLREFATEPPQPGNEMPENGLTLRRNPDESDEAYEERKKLFDDLKKAGGRIAIGIEELPESMIERLRKQAVEFPDAEIAEMMIAGASLDEILAAHPDADIDKVMRWHADKHGDDLSNTHAAREWLRQKGR